MRIYLEVNGKSVTEARKEIQSTLENMGIDIDFGSMPDGDEILPVSVEIPDFDSLAPFEGDEGTPIRTDPYGKEETIRKFKDWLSEDTDQYVSPAMQAAIREKLSNELDEVVDFDDDYYVDYDVNGQPYTIAIHAKNAKEAAEHFKAIKENGELYGRIG